MNPPYCKLKRIKSARSEKEKIKLMRAKSDKSKQKEIRFSDRIEEHDVEIKVNRLTELLRKRYRVKVTIIFRRR